MSLLLEALKKAEKAKEDAQRRARGDTGDAAPVAAPAPALQPAAGLRLEGEAPAPAEERVLTRAELPDLSTPVDITSDDLRANAPPPRSELRLETPKEPPRRPAAQAAAAQPAAQTAEREAQRTSARKVFEAKFKEPNPQLPFYLTLGALGACAVGVVIYFWYQLRPPYPLVNANPPRPAAEAQVAVAPAPPAATAPAPSASPAAQIPGLPAATPPAKPAPAAQPVPQSATPAVPRPAAPRAPAALPVEKPQLAPAPSTEVAVSRATPQIHPRVNAGYAAYQSGDLAKARMEYEQALGDEPTNRDALLGMAAVETRSGRYEAAEAAYLRLLQVDPRDSHAQAGLMALRSARLDPLAAESRVKSMLAQDPGAHALNFALGNQLAQQGRWAEAQQEYFKAFAGDPENADFAYNLAVSLDHLRQLRLARDYYQRAAALAERRGASFDPAAARARAAQLGN